MFSSQDEMYRGQWLEVVEYLQDNPLIIVKGFKRAGIHETLGILNDDIDLQEDGAENEDTDEDEDSSDDQGSSDEGDHWYLEDVVDDNSTHMPLIVPDIFTYCSQKLTLWNLQ